MSTPDSSPEDTPTPPPPHGASSPYQDPEAPSAPPPKPEPPRGDHPANRDEHNLGTLAHLLALFTFFVGPLALWLVYRDRSPYLERQSQEALNFQITVGIALFVSGLLVALFIGVILLPLVIGAHVVMTLLATIKASEGELYRYPFSLRLLK